MWKKFIEFIRKLLNKNKQLHSSFLLSDEEVERRIEQQEDNLKLLHETIGSNPLDQIDWIIENGYDEYYKKYKSYQDGSISKKEEIEFNVGDNIQQLKKNEDGTWEYKYATEEAMNIGYIKGTLEDMMKDRVNVHSSDNLLTTKKEHVKDAVRYVSKCHGNLVIQCKSGKVYQWEGYGAEQYVLMEDIDDEFLHNRIHMYLERVSESEIRTFGEMIKTIENEQPVKEDLTLTLEQARVFHEKTNKGTPLRSVCRQVEKELEKYNIEFDIDNEDILAEIITRSIQRFHVSSRTSLDLDVNSGYFKEVLKEREIGILVKWMAYLYTDNLFKIDERLSSYLSARDYRMTYGSGNANLQKISERFEESARIMQFKYDLEDWTEVRGGIGGRIIHRF